MATSTYKYKVINTTKIRSDYRVSPSGSSAIVGSESSGTIVYIVGIKGSGPTKYGGGNYYKLSQSYLGLTAYIAVNDVEKYTESDAAASGDEVVRSNYKATGVLATDVYVYIIDSYYTSKGNDASTGTVLKKGAKVSIQQQSTNGFYKIGDSKWIPMSVVNITTSDGKTIQKVDKTTAEYKEATSELAVKKQTTADYKEAVLSATTFDKLYGSEKLAASTTTVRKLMVKSLNGIHGVPYQFMPNVDRRLSSSGCLGRKYAERIIAKMPLLLMTPGEPDFLPTYSKNEANAIVEALVKGTDKLSGSNLQKILKKPGRYYTFKFAYSSYYKYVNSLLHMCAIYLGIGSKYHANGTSGSVYSAKLKDFRWDKAVNKDLKGFINSKESVAFYLDSDTSISESFTTNTTQSKIMETVNGFSDTAKELQFLAGPIAGLKVQALQSDDFDATLKDIQGISSKYLNNNRLFNNLGEMFATVGKGGKLAFPEIWDDTEFSKSYDISIKLRTPDSDKLSWYLNICVPLIHLLGMAAPRQLGPNGYRSPFLVRAYYKGLFNCDMGIITSMSITKGKDSAWSADGLPTEVDVSITLKDLYSLLTITNAYDTSVSNFLNNTCLMDYLANTCGVNINKPEITRTLETYVMLTKNKIQDAYGNKWLEFQNGLSNYSATAYKKFSGMSN